MNDVVRILHLEDNASDAELVARELKRGGVEAEIRVVANRQDFLHALKTFLPEVILSDYTLPGYGGEMALEDVLQNGIDAPFIYVSGGIGEDRAIEALKRGATDYILKERPARLIPAIQRALREAEEHRRRVSSEMMLQEEHRKFRLILENISSVVWITDKTGATSFIGSNVSRVVGFHAEEIISNPDLWLTRIHPEDSGAVHEAWNGVFAGSSFDLTYRYQRKDGEWIWVHDRAMTVYEEGGLRHVYGIFDDVTEKRKAGERQRQMQKFEAIGNLAAGVAHEINNPLTYILTNLETLRDETSSYPPAAAGRAAECRERLSETVEGVLRIRDIVRELKIFSRQDEDQSPIERVDLRQVIGSAVTLAMPQARALCSITVEGNEPAFVRGNERRLVQIVLNLLVNAIQAMSVKQSNVNRITIRLKQSPDHAVMEIADNGAGIPPQVIDRIFDPYFTTKPDGIGTGLGLAVCLNIMKALGGEIVVESSPEMGTCFRLIFPRNAEEPEASPAVCGNVPPAAAADAPGTATRLRILVVDDEPGIRKAARRILMNDHEVATAVDGEEALALIQSGGEFDVIFSDITMPRMSGQVLYGAIAEHRPGLELRIIIMTGGALSPESREFLEHIPNSKLDKPFGKSELLAAVERMGPDPK